MVLDQPCRITLDFGAFEYDGHDAPKRGVRSLQASTCCADRFGTCGRRRRDQQARAAFAASIFRESWPTPSPDPPRPACPRRSVLGCTILEGALWRLAARGRLPPKALRAALTKLARSCRRGSEHLPPPWRSTAPTP